MAAQLEASGDFRILRRLKPRDVLRQADDQPKKIGIILDVETTGLDVAADEVIELGMVAFEFSAEGQVYRLLGTFSGLRDPGRPIPEDVTALTGITNEMVAGKAIDTLEVCKFVDAAAVVIAHNASFDRRFAEGVWECFVSKAWACSMSEIDWSAEHFEGARLSHLLSSYGLFHDGHRAVEDCMALLEVLARPLPQTGETALRRLLDTARKATVRIWAENAPYEFKNVLKTRGYRWSDGADGQPRAWWRDVPEDSAEDEIIYLKTNVFRRENVEIPMKRITAFDRHSSRCWSATK